MNKIIKALLGLIFGASDQAKKTVKAAAGSRAILSKGRMANKEQKLGKVVHLYHKINVAIIELAKPLKVGDNIHFVGSTTDVTQAVGSLQVNHQAVSRADKGEQVGLLLAKGIVVKEGDEVYLAE
jgi:predicted ribosome-associated RNA-binding protein Tma20